MTVFANFEEVIAAALKKGRRRLALVQAASEELMQALKEATDAGLIEPVLIGRPAVIERDAAAVGLDLSRCVVEPLDGDDEAAVKRGVEIIKAGEAHLIMKGQLKTATYLRGVLSGKSGLKTAGRVTHVAFTQAPNYHKLFGGTDGGVVIHPSFEDKVEITRNGVRLLTLLGYENPKVGALAYSETAREDDPETWDAHRLMELAEKGEFGPIQFYGPMGYDMLFDRHSALIKNCSHPVAGDIDLYIAPDITACNAPTKAVYLNGGQAAGVLVGTRAPVLMLSRADSEKTRLNTMAMGVLIAHGIECNGGF